MSESTVTDWQLERLVHMSLIIHICHLTVQTMVIGTATVFSAGLGNMDLIHTKSLIVSLRKAELNRSTTMASDHY